MSTPALDPHARVATRDEGCDDNGEPLCSEPAQSDVAGDTWRKFPVLNRVETVIRLPRHHIDTEGAE